MAAPRRGKPVKFFYYLGKVLQIGSLLVMPAAIWAGQIGHDERGAITIFVGSMVAFLAGMGLIQLASRA